MAMIKSPLKAIRAKCMDCTAGSRTEIQNCPIQNCPLHPFRFGKNPFRQKREMSEEQKQKMSEILKRAREARFEKKN